MRSRVTVMLGLALLGMPSACGSAQMVLKDPISDKCAASGLQGCDELTDGVLLYVDGNKREGEEKVKRGAAANSPEKVKAFAKNLEPILELPGVSSYSGPLKGVIHLLAMTADASPPAPGGGSVKSTAETAVVGADSAQSAPPPSRSQGPPAASAPSNLDPTRIRTRTFFPAQDEKGLICDEAILAVPGRSCTRVKAFSGPIVLTNVHLSAGCPDELMIFSEDDQHAVRWILVTPAGTALTIAGGGLNVPEADIVYVGARSTPPAGLHKDAHCSVTFSGWRPQADMFELPPDRGH